MWAAWVMILCGFCFWVCGAAAQSTASADTADCAAEETLIRLEESCNRRGPITFTFHQQTISAVFGNESTQEGRVWLDPSGRFRVETDHETFISSGDTLWHWVPAYNQVTVRVRDLSSRAGSPTDFLYSLRRHFIPVDCQKDTLEGKVFLKVRTVAKTATAAVQRLTIWIDPLRFLVERAEYVDYNDDRVNLYLSGVSKDSGDYNARYRLDFPDSVEVIVFPQKKRQQNPTGPR